MSTSTKVTCDRCGALDDCDPSVGPKPAPPKDWGSFSMSFRGRPDIAHDLCPACVTLTAVALAPVPRP